MDLTDFDLVSTFVDRYPRAAARELELLPLETSAELIAYLDLRMGSALILNMLPSYAARVCSVLHIDVVSSLLSESDVNRILPILRCMTKLSRETTLKRLPQKKSKICQLLLSYTDDMVGAWMDVDIFALPAESTVDDALKRLSASSAALDCNAVPVVSEDYKPLGILSLRALVCSSKGTLVSTLIDDKFQVLSSRASLASAVQNRGWSQVDSLFVLNRNHQLVGLLQHSVLRRALARFGEKSNEVSIDDPISAVSEAYIGTLGTLIGLVCDTSEQTHETGEKQ